MRAGGRYVTMDLPGLFLFSGAGAILGITGAVPFFHANAVLQFAGTILPLAGLAVFAVSLSFSRLAFEAFSSIFLLVPSESQAASILPGHRMVLAGRGEEALETAIRSFALALVASVLLLPFFLAVSGDFYGAVKPFVLPLLLLAVFAMLFLEKTGEKFFLGALVFLLSGAFGFLSLSLDADGKTLFPLLSGLFGFSSILASSIGTKSEEGLTDVGFKVAARGDGKKEVFAGVAAGIFSSFLPALSPAFLSAFAFAFFEGRDERGFIALNSAVIASKMFFDVFAVFTIGKARSAAAAAIVPAVESGALAAMDFAAMALVAFAFSLLLFYAARPFLFRALRRATRASGQLNKALFALLFLAVLGVSGFYGLFIAAVATAIGMLPVLLGVKRSFAMGALMLPAMVYLSGTNLLGLLLG